MTPRKFHRLMMSVCLVVSGGASTYGFYAVGVAAFGYFLIFLADDVIAAIKGQP